MNHYIDTFLLFNNKVHYDQVHHHFLLLFTINSFAESSSGFTEIFNGKDLSGWTVRNGKATYRVENGTIIGKTVEGEIPLCTDKLYGDFELIFKVKFLNHQLNSGVQIRSNDDNNKKEEWAQELAATKKLGSRTAYIYGEACGGWITPEVKLIHHNHVKNDAWNEIRVVAKGAKIQTWVNGNQVSDIISEEKFKSHSNGFIGLQVHQFQKVRDLMKSAGKIFVSRSINTELHNYSS